MWWESNKKRNQKILKKVQNFDENVNMKIQGAVNKDPSKINKEI
jgi:hypothetical protein